jgi:hypothetical protein
MKGQQRKKPLVKDEPISAGTHQVAQKSHTTKIHKCLVPTFLKKLYCILK